MERWNPSNPVIKVKVGPNGRVEHIQANIKIRHLRKGPRKGRGYTERIKRFVESLGKVQGEKDVREGDEVGHVVGDAFNGPTDRTYNFFPQSPFCNMEYYHKVEKAIHIFLIKQELTPKGDNAHVTLDVQFDYVDYYDYPNRPRRLRIKLVYSDGREESFEISNL